MMLAMVLATCGCSKDFGGQNADNRVKANLATGGTTGNYYAVGKTMQTVLNRNLSRLELAATVSSGSMTNIGLISDHEAQLAIVQGDVLYYAHKGTDMFEGTPCNDVLWIAGLYYEVVQIVATKDITSVEQLRGKTVCVGNAHSDTEITVAQILAAHGMSFEDVDVVYGSFQTGLDGMREGTIDATVIVATVPDNVIAGLTKTERFHMISLANATMATLEIAYPFLTRVDLPAGTYNCAKQELICAAVPVALVADKDLPEGVAYELTKSLFENSQALREDAGFLALDAKTACKSAVPLHPGAERYYKEIGVL